MRVFLAGHNGMVGRAVLNELQNDKSLEIVTKSRRELNLLDQSRVMAFFQNERIDQAYLAAAKVGGIHANNTYPAQFLYENLMIEANVIHAAHCSDVNKLLFLGSSCIYPKVAPQPISENALLTGKLEPTNEPYAISKIAGIKLCESYHRQYGRDYRSVMPTNLYGPHDNFHGENSHVIPGLLSRFHDAVANNASEITIWGSGKPTRDFLHVNDMSNASVFVMNMSETGYWSTVDSQNSHINVGSGEDCSIHNLAEEIADVTGFSGALGYDASKPDGTLRKLLDTSVLNRLGWRPKIGLSQGLEATYSWFVKNQSEIRK